MASAVKSALTGDIVSAAHLPVGRECDAATLTLNERGMICDCNNASESLFGYRRGEMVWRHVSMLFPQLACIELLKDGQANAWLRFLCRVGARFQAQRSSGECFASDLFLNNLDNPGVPRLRMIVRRGEQQ